MKNTRPAVSETDRHCITFPCRSIRAPDITGVVPPSPNHNTAAQSQATTRTLVHYTITPEEKQLPEHVRRSLKGSVLFEESSRKVPLSLCVCVCVCVCFCGCRLLLSFSGSVHSFPQSALKRAVTHNQRALKTLLEKMLPAQLLLLPLYICTKSISVGGILDA